MEAGAQEPPNTALTAPSVRAQSTVSAELRLWLDKLAICELVRLERFYRDRGMWEELAACYTEDSRVKTTWFEGSGAEFAAASREMAQRGRHSIHPINPVWIQIDGDRALVESTAQILNRSTIDGVEVDMTMDCRFFSRVLRTASGWRLATFDGIYHRDSITTVHPGDALPLARSELHGLRPSYRIWAWAMRRRGYEVSQDELGDDRPDLLEPFYRAAQQWLAQPRSPAPGATPRQASHAPGAR